MPADDRSTGGAERSKLALAVLLTALVTIPTTAALTLRWERREAPPAFPPATASDEPIAKLVPPPTLRREDISARAVGALKVSGTDLNGDGDDELVLAGDTLRVLRSDGQVLASLPAPGGVQVLEAFGGAVLAGWGRTKAAVDAQASVVRYTLSGAELRAEAVLNPAGERQQVVAIAPMRDALLLAWFSDKYLVQAVKATGKGQNWTTSPLAEARTAPVWLPGDLDGDGKEDLVIGRTYGDQQGSDGDAVLQRASGERVPIPTTRGVRAGCLADTNGDGHPEVALADGWDKDYGHKAKAQLRLAWWADGGVSTTVLDLVQGDNDVSRLLAADIDGDGRDELLAVTNNRLRVVEKEGDSWIAWDAAQHVEDAAILRGPAGVRVVVIGPTSELLSR